MPSRLKPTNPTAEDAILVGDPGRALMLAQELLVNPLMSNHARGLWGYTAATAGGRPLSIQATGMGGPSAAIVLHDLFKLGLRRAIRVGTCEALDPELEAGSLVVVEAAIAGDGTARALLGESDGRAPIPADPELRRRLSPGGSAATVLSVDLAADVAAAANHHVAPPVDLRLGGDESAAGRSAPAVYDLQTAALLALGGKLGVAVAALLVVERVVGLRPTSGPRSPRLDAEQLEEPMKAAGRLAAEALANPQAQG